MLKSSPCRQQSTLELTNIDAMLLTGIKNIR